MTRRARPRPDPTPIELTITGTADRGRGVARLESGQVVFVSGAVPGDRVLAQVTGAKKQLLEARMTELLEPGPDRREPFCRHFWDCGGCRWQHLDYEAQLAHKRTHLAAAMRHIGQVTDLPEVAPTLPSPLTRRYRNKLEFSFSHNRWFTSSDPAPVLPEGSEYTGHRGALGFHAPGRFDKVLHIVECHLQPEPMNALRNNAWDWVAAQGVSCYNPRLDISVPRRGVMRTLMMRNTLDGQWLVLLQIAEPEPEIARALLDHLAERHPEVETWCYAINQKGNDTLEGVEVIVHRGPGVLYETLEGLQFAIGPRSFFQTNPHQASRLYDRVRELAGLTGQEVVYDLYTGTGTIVLYLARHAARVVGVEYVPEAVEDARANARANGIDNATFVAGDMARILTPAFVATHGRPDVLVTDPPRGGMAPEVIATILGAAPRRVVYVSCNPATQARDIALMTDHYRPVWIEPVDMFPHTDHAESVVVLERTGD